MASGFVQTNGRVIAGEGDPVEGDGLCVNLSIFPENSLYINNNTGKLWVRNAETGFLADWVGASGGAGGDPFLPVTGTGTATGAIIGDLAGNTLNIIEGVNDFLNINPTAGSESAILQAFNITGTGNIGQFGAATTNTQGQFNANAQFNGGADVASIIGTAESGVSSIVHTADTHTFNLNGILSAVFGGNDFLSIDPTAGSERSELRAYNTTGDDNTATVSLITQNDTSVSRLDAVFNDGATLGQIEIEADASSSTITHTADTHTFNAGGQGNLEITIDTAFIRGFDPTDDDNIATVVATASTTGAVSRMDASFNNGVKLAKIEMEVDATTSSITHIADTHTFTGRIINNDLVADDFVNDAAASVGGIAVGGLYHTSGVVKVRLA